MSDRCWVVSSVLALPLLSQHPEGACGAQGQSLNSQSEAVSPHKMFHSPQPERTQNVIDQLDALVWRVERVKKPPASDCTLQSIWPELSFFFVFFSHAHRARDQICAPISVRACSSATTSPRAVCTKLYGVQAEGTDSSSLLALQPGSVQVWPARHLTASAGRRRDSRCGWGWWLSSFSGSNWDESADGTAAVNGFLRLFTWEQNGSNPGYFWREYTRNAVYLFFAFCRIAAAVNHMI